MRLRSLPGKLGLVVVTVVAPLGAMSTASAQVIVSPNAEATRNDGGWIYWIAVALVVLGLLVALAIAIGYMRYAPRFQRDEGAPRTVKAPRIQPGRDAPRRPVNITGAPVVVPAPAVVTAAPAAVPAAVAAPAAATPAAATPAVATPAVATPVAAPAADPSTPAPATPIAPTLAEPSTTEGMATTPSEEPPAAPAPAPAPGGEHKEVSLDQETFDRVLAELLEKGTTRRVAEGQARRAAMIAARKKAGG